MANIVTACLVDVILIQETHVYAKTKINIPGYYAFCRNRSKVGSKGGIAILVAEEIKDQCVLIHEGKEAEVIAIKMCHTVPHTVFVNYYGAQENTTPPATIASHISEVFDLVNKQSEGGNLVVLAGDFNISIGNHVLQDNHPLVSKGGKLFNALLEDSDDLSLENTRYGGSSITHMDASGGRGKCLDFVVGNTLASERMTSFLVDETKVITPYTYHVKSGTRRYTDHLSLYWELGVRVNCEEEDDEAKPVYVWNHRRPLGDGRFAFYLDKAVGKLVKCNNMNTDINIVYDKMKKEINNAKQRGYGRREINIKTWEHVEEERIEQYRLEEVKKVVDKIREDRKNHRVPLQVFACRKSHLMAERGETFSSVRDPVSGKIVETRKEIYKATVKHNEITLEQNEGQAECYKQLTEFKVQYVEWAKMIESEDPKDETIYLEEYLIVLNELQSRNKSCYADIKKWGPRFRIFVYWLMKRMYEEEQVPEDFLKTNLQALYKKGSRMELGNYRFLHLKESFAKIFETLVMRKVKADMWAKFPTSQIGGCPASRTTEHLYLLISLMLEFEHNSQRGGAQGCIIIFKDVEKAFDKVSTKNTLFAAARSGVKGKNLRILDKLNRKTTFKVIGDPEETEFTKEWVGGQGTVFTCTACSLTMPEPMERNIREYEEETGEELGVRVGQDNILVGEVDFVDDKASVSRDVKSARVKGILMTRSMEEINVRVHPVKTKYMILGTEKFKEETRRELQKSPIVVQGHEIQESREEKYLGMQICDGGSKETIRRQMEARVQECKKKIALIKNLLEKPSMKAMGYLACVKTLFESIMTATALYSSGVWVGLKKKDTEWYDRECKALWYTLLKINSKTTWLQVCWECGILPWSWGIVREKLNLVSFLHHGKVSQTGRLAVSESKWQVKYGIVEEARVWAERLKLPNPSEVPLSSETVSEAVWEAARAEMWESVVSSKYIKAPVMAERTTPDYFFDTSMTNHEQMIWFSYRLGILEFRKRYANKYLSSECIYNCGEQDTLEHSIECTINPIKLRGSSDGEMLEYLKNLHDERVKTVGTGIYWL